MAVEEKFDEPNMEDIAEYEDNLWINTKRNVREQEISVGNFMNMPIEKIYVEFGDAVIKELEQVQDIIRSYEDPKDCEYKGCVQCNEQICAKFEFMPGRVYILILVTENKVRIKALRKRYAFITGNKDLVTGNMIYFQKKRKEDALKTFNTALCAIAACGTFCICFSYIISNKSK